MSFLLIVKAGDKQSREVIKSVDDALFAMENDTDLDAAAVLCGLRPDGSIAEPIARQNIGLCAARELAREVAS